MKETEIELYRKAGIIAAAARDLGAGMIKPGVRLEEVQLALEDLIRQEGGGNAFPSQISLNNVAAHDCCPPGDPRVFTDQDIAKLDVGVHVQGYVADTATTVDLRDGPDSPLVKASRMALEAAIALVKPKARVGDLGAAIEETIDGLGFRPVANLTGHGVGRFQIHCSPQVPNIKDRSGQAIKADTALAIEPFACDGKGWVDDLGEPQVFQIIRRLRSRDHLPFALEKALKAFNGLPFARRDLARFVEPTEIETSLQLLTGKRLITQYPPLAERKEVRVSQAEHTMLIFKDQVLVITDPERPPIGIA